MVLKKDRVVCGGRGGGGSWPLLGNLLFTGQTILLYIVWNLAGGGSVDKAFSCSDKTSNT